MKRTLLLFGLILCLIISNTPKLSAQGLFFELVRKIEIEKLIREGNLENAIAIIEKNIMVDLLSENWNQYVFHRFKLADILVKRGDFYKAKNEAYSALDSAYKYIEIENQNLSDYYYKLGSLCIDWGDLDNASYFLFKSLDAMRHPQPSNEVKLFQIFYKIGSYHFYNKSIDSSLIYYKKALENYSGYQNDDPFLSDILQSIGIVNFLIGNIQESEQFLERSFSISKTVYHNDYDKLSLIYMNLGMFYLSASDYSKSLDFLTIAESLNKKLIIPNKIRLYAIYWNKGLGYLFLGENEYAIQYLELAYIICKNLYNNNYEYLNPLIMDLAYAYENFEKNDSALLYLRKCLTTKDERLRVKTYINLSSIFHKLNLNDSAKYYIYKAKHIIEYENINDKILTAYAMRKIGEYFSSDKDPRGLFYLNEAMKLYSNNEYFKEDISQIYRSLAKYYSNSDNLDSTLKYLSKAVIALQSKSIASKKDSNNQTELVASPLLIQILIDKFRLLNDLYEIKREKYYISNAIKVIHECTDYIFRLLTFYNDRETRVKLTMNYENIYEEAIHSCLVAYRHTGDSSYLYRAFDFSERNKSMNLLLTLKDETAKDLGNIPDSLRQREKDIQLEKYIYNKSLYEENKKDEPDGHKIRYWNEKILDLELEYNQLLSELENNYPDYYALKYDFGTAGVREIQRRLEKDAMLLEYTIGNDSIFIFCLTRQDYTVLSKPADSTLVEDIFTLRNNLSIYDIHLYEKSHFLQYQESAYRLYDLLMLPFAGKAGITDILIVPDDELGYLSFDMLLSQESHRQKVDFRNLPYVIRNHNISYIPSATLLVDHLKKKDDGSRTGLLAFAPVYSGGGSHHDLLNDRRNLPGAIREINDIPGRYFGKKLTMEEATEHNFKKLASKYDILHLAMHTRINDEYPMTSVLKFYKQGDGTEDGLLHIYEIFGLKLNSRMVVLSACSSGNGKLEKGEGINSLARAFLYAGAESIIMTLWDVEDGASRKLITLFYEFLAKGYPKDEALRLAKLRYLDTLERFKEGHPYFWSGYIIYGDNEPIQYPMFSLARYKSQSLLLIALLFVISSLVLYRKYKNRQRNKYPWRDPYIRRHLKRRSASARSGS